MRIPRSTFPPSDSSMYGVIVISTHPFKESNYADIGGTADEATDFPIESENKKYEPKMRRTRILYSNFRFFRLLRTKRRLKRI